MGFLVNNIRPELAEKYMIQEDSGIVITDIFPNGVAIKAGLVTGDLIIALNGKKVDSRRQFNEMLAKISEEGSIFLLVRRGEDSIHIALPQKG